MNSSGFPPAGSRVVVAMSGGVDSSVAAALLVEQGFEVVGMMLRLWNDDGCATENRCCTPDALAEARRVARRLGIPFYAIDAEQTFHQRVVVPFLERYGAGVTPNPCLLCNPNVRWQVLLEEAEQAGASALATGHYARLIRNESGQSLIVRGADEAKDQSYVLAFLTQKQLQRTHFPLADLTKAEVRAIASRLGLSVADRPDSQDLCFAPNGYQEFLQRHAPKSLRPGDIVDGKGRNLGRHKGLPLFTIGQRKGLGVPSLVPLFVTHKDITTNRLVVGTRQELGRTLFRVRQTHWHLPFPESGLLECLVKTRYKAPLVRAVVRIEKEGDWVVRTETPVRDITPGQGAVFYSDNCVLGAGVIAGCELDSDAGLGTIDGP